MVNFLLIVRKIRFYKHPEAFSSFEKKYMSFVKSNMAATYYFSANSKNVKIHVNEKTLDIDIFFDSNLNNLILEDKCFLISNLVCSNYFLLEHIFSQTLNPVVCRKLFETPEAKIQNILDNFSYNTVSTFHNNIKLSRKVNSLMKVFKTFGFPILNTVSYTLYGLNVSVNIALVEPLSVTPLGKDATIFFYQLLKSSSWIHI